MDSFYPRSYDLTSLPQAAQFVEDFKLTTCLCFKHFKRDYVRLMVLRRVDDVMSAIAPHFIDRDIITVNIIYIIYLM